MNREPKEQATLPYYFFYTATLFVIVGGLKLASEIIVILFLSLFIATVINALYDTLRKFHIPKAISYLFVAILLMVVVALLIYILGASMKNFARDLPFYEEKIRLLMDQSILFFKGYDVDLDIKALFDGLDFSYFFQFTTSTVGSIGTLFSKFIFVMIGVAFILFESREFEQKIEIIFKQDRGKIESFQLFSHNLKKYLVIKTFTSLLTGGIIAVTLILFDIPYPILWGMLGFLLNYIPFIGSLVAAIPALMLALIHVPIVETIWLGVAYFIINNVITNIIEPRFMGKGLGLSPVVIFFSLLFWGWTLGIVGMLLAVPLTMTLKLAFDSSHRTRWLGILMSNTGSRKG
jgi:predicted PurR-regulated permease PerM